jgi:hypothetical protein
LNPRPSGAHLKKKSIRREPIGFQPYRGQFWICNRSDEAVTLSSIAGWRPGSFMALDHTEEIAELERRGLVTVGKRYALTDAGFARLAEIGWALMHDETLEVHMSDETQVPDYMIGSAETKKRVRKPRPARQRVRVIRPKTKSHKAVKRK